MPLDYGRWVDSSTEEVTWFVDGGRCVCVKNVMKKYTSMCVTLWTNEKKKKTVLEQFLTLVANLK